MTMSKLYLECNAGISGDMTVGALLDLGADREVLKQALSSLPLFGFQIKIGRVKKSGLDVCDFAVLLDREYENNDHDMEYLHGAPRTEPKRAHKTPDGGCRTLSEITEIIRQSGLTKRAKETAIRIFTVLGEAEAKAHGESPETVHFHEVGAVDSIVDIAAAAVCLDDLDITEVIVPKLCEGTGTVRCAHGILPVPVPAVTNIVSEYQIALEPTGVFGELITPTGAAIAAAIRTDEKLPETFRIKKIGLGAGKRSYERPSILRAMLIETDGKEDSDAVYQLVSDIDDCSGEALGFVMERLMEAGAKDVHYLPVYMKKNRPGYELVVICRKRQIPDLERIIFQNTTTIGIRRIRTERTTLPRTLRTVMTDYGEAQVKVCEIQGKERVYPEYESVAAICKEQNADYQTVYREIVQAWQKEN